MRLSALGSQVWFNPQSWLNIAGVLRQVNDALLEMEAPGALIVKPLQQRRGALRFCCRRLFPRVCVEDFLGLPTKANLEENRLP